MYYVVCGRVGGAFSMASIMGGAGGLGGWVGWGLGGLSG